ncbi:vomeronasal type-2 receptor 26-like [Gastrophryne carolinensis]
MVYAIQEINNSPDILPNITLGFHLYDSCYDQVLSLMGTLWILSGHKPAVPNFNCHTHSKVCAIVGDMPSKASIPVARILGLYQYPQVSYASAHPSLSNKVEFPSFLRTIPNDDYVVIEFANLVNYFNWTYVGVLTTDNELGRSGSQLLTKVIENNGGCVAFLEILPIYNSMESVYRIIDVIKATKAKVIVVYSTMENLISLMEGASKENITDKVWLGCGSWSITSDFPRPDILVTLNGSLGISPPSGKIPGFKEFLNSIHPTKYPDDIYMKSFWETAFGCVWPPSHPFNMTFLNKYEDAMHWCTGQERLDSIDPNIYDVNNFRYTYKTHNAVFAIAHALHELHSCVPGQGPFVNGSCANIFSHKPWQTPISVCSQPCAKGFRRSSQQGLKICCFDCVSCSDGEILNPNDTSKCLKCPEDQWPEIFKEKCTPKPFSFLAYDELLGFSLASLSIICCLLTSFVIGLFLVKRETPIVRANNRELSYILLVSLMFCFLCSLIFIGRPNRLTCMMRQVVFGIVFSVCLSAILAKTITVILVFHSIMPESRTRKLVGYKIPLSIIPSSALIQVIICSVWLSCYAPFEQQNMALEIGTIVIECNEGSNILFSCVLGYLGLLASISLIVAFIARNLPDTFNEAKCITFSMLMFASIWISCVPAYVSTKGKYMVAVEIFSIISSSAGLLVCIFLPKCYIILLHPEMNDKRYITRSKWPAQEKDDECH